MVEAKLATSKPDFASRRACLFVVQRVARLLRHGQHYADAFSGKGGFYGKGGYGTPDVRIALSYTRSTRKAGLTKCDGEPRIIVLGLAVLGKVRFAGNGQRGLTNQTRMSSPDGKPAGLEICVPFPRRRTVVFARVIVHLISGTFGSVMNCTEENEPLCPLNLVSRRRWENMPHLLC